MFIIEEIPIKGISSIFNFLKHFYNKNVLVLLIQTYSIIERRVIYYD